MTHDSIRALLPWQPPFLMVDRMVECEPHRKIVTTKNISADDMFMRGSVPDGHGYPGALLVEGMSQSAALLFQLTYGKIEKEKMPLLGSLEASWESTVRPGDVVTYTVSAIKMTSIMGIFEGVAHVEGSAVAKAELAFSVTGSPQDENT